jgi:hypothetical protein
MDELLEKTEALLKSLLSVKTGASKDLMVPALKAPSMKVSKPSIKQPSLGKIPSGLPPPSKKDPTKVAEQLKNPQPGKVKVEVLKVESNGQWSLDKADAARLGVKPSNRSLRPQNPRWDKPEGRCDSCGGYHIASSLPSHCYNKKVKTGSPRPGEDKGILDAHNDDIVEHEPKK